MVKKQASSITLPACFLTIPIPLLNSKHASTQYNYVQKDNNVLKSRRGAQTYMIPYSGQETTAEYSQERITISAFTLQSQLTTAEQIRRFELLRLAFFTLKLRKLELRVEQMEQGRRNDHSGEVAKEIKDQKDQRDQSEYTWRCSLLRHAIFQQIVTLTKLNAREQAMQLIEACRR